jgi:hypothetical protein
MRYFLQRLLRALGYMATWDLPAQTNEDIQMHADKIFHKMLAQEKAINEAKEAGLPAPEFKTLIPRDETKMVIEPNEKIKAAWAKRLAGLPETERNAELRALRADFEAQVKIAGDVQQVWVEQAAERRQRQAEGKGTVGDAVKGLLSWNKENEAKLGLDKPKEERKS